MIELALPAGSLESALTAFSYGADAVYFGLKDFSARKGAVNFSIEDLSKIREYTKNNNKKSYITINTLIDDKTFPSLIETLNQVAFYGTDGLIVQDLGVAEIVRKYFPSLPLHGSTQLAVHTTEGVKVLQSLGFERVVLSRELNLKEMEQIRKDCPDIELKAFIHGALCYGFSGLCSASALKCGRSANGGECAQICRSWFLNKENGEKGYFFSMEDMVAGEKLLDLERIGIDSAKVEGRLKSPEYVASVTRYYRSILDNGHATKNEKEDIKTTFLRKSGTGYLEYKKNRPSLLSGDYPGHMGIRCGKVIKEKGLFKTIETLVKVDSHDGLQYFTSKDGLLSPEKFSPQIVERGHNYIVIKLDTKEYILGKDVYKISDSTKREKTQSTNIPLYRKPVDISITITHNSITSSALGENLTKELEISEAKTPKDIKKVLERTFRESGLSKYTLGTLTVNNDSGIEYPFLPPSIMKDFRREFYSILEQKPLEKITIEEPSEGSDNFILPNRNLLKKDLPWNIEPIEIDGRTYITLPPVTFNERKVWDEALKNIEGLKNVTIGLNNISQLNFAHEHPEYDYFADIYLYVSNKYGASLLKREIPSLIGGYLWFERKSFSSPWPWTPTITDFEPPFFISRTCFRHDALKKDCKGCSQNENYTIEQYPDEFTVKVRSCLTIVERNKKW